MNPCYIFVWEGTWKRSEVQNTETTSITPETSSNSSLFLFFFSSLTFFNQLLFFVEHNQSIWCFLRLMHLRYPRQRKTLAEEWANDKRDVQNKKKKQVVTACFRGSTGGFCVLDFWPFSSFFSNKDVTRFVRFFLKQEKLTTVTVP